MNAIISITLLSATFGQPAAVGAKALPPKVEEDVVAATVRVINRRKDPTKDSIGNGVIIDRTATGAYVLTAGHIVKNSDQVEVRVYGTDAAAKSVTYATVKVVKQRTEKNQDLALLFIEGYKGASAGLKICPQDSAPTEKPFAAFFSACREGKSAIVRTETIEKSERVTKRDEPTPAKFWRSARRTIGSESGGPLLNARGQVIGICSGSASGADGEHGYFCHLEEIHAFIRSEGLGFLFEKKKTP